MGKLTKGFLLGVASALGAYYYKNPEEAKKHKELILDNVQNLLDKINSNQESDAIVEAEEVEVEEDGIYLQSNTDKVEDEVNGEEKEKLDSLLSAFEPKEDEIKNEKVLEVEKEETSKSGLVAGAAVLGGAAVATPFLADALSKDEADAEESIIEDEPRALEELVKESATREEKVEENLVGEEQTSTQDLEELTTENVEKDEREVLVEEFAGKQEELQEEVIFQEEAQEEVLEQEVNDFSKELEPTLEEETLVEEVEETELTDEEELARLDREIAELEAQLKEEELDEQVEESEVVHTFDLSEANLEEETQEEEVSEYTYEEPSYEDLGIAEEDYSEEVLEEEAPAKKSFFGKLKSMVGLGKKEEVEDTILTEDLQDLSVEDLKADLEENVAGAIPTSLEEVKEQATDKVDGVKEELLKRADLHGLEEKTPTSSLEDLVAKVKGDIAEKEASLNGEEETKETKGALGSIVSLFTSKK